MFVVYVCIYYFLNIFHISGSPWYGPFALRGYVTSFLWKWKLYDFACEKRLVGYILNKNNSELVFQTRTIFLKRVRL